MKKHREKTKYKAGEWSEISAFLSGEKLKNSGLSDRFMAEDNNTAKRWKDISDMDIKEINVDRAWKKLYSRLDNNKFKSEALPSKNMIRQQIIFRIAAAALILIAIASGVFYMTGKGLLDRKTIVATSDNQKNLQVTLPDGSIICLNRNTELSYRKNFGRQERTVMLKGEAFFEIAPDAGNHFIVETGNAKVKVTGTSFNVITNNEDKAVEVFVMSGSVILADNKGKKTLELDPGFIGTMNITGAGKKRNDNPNYLSWNTGMLVYDGQTLDIVFRDLKKVYNMEIIADDPAILNNTWTSPINNQPQETIIRLICTSFNLDYMKDGNIYHLARK
jgi:ferric-dicitrate binding protein FerR (iron transport regulator)